MKIDLTKATFIIPIRIESSDRLRNVITTTAFLLENFDTNIIIKEVDKESVFQKDALPILKDILNIDINVNHIFEQSNDSSFHRQRVLNEMIMESKTDIVVNYDCDVLLPLESYKTAYESVLSAKCDVVYPYGQGIYQYQVKATDEIVSQFLQTYDFDILEKNSNQYISDFGWVQFFNRQVYIDGGMENENFIAYAPEDKERFYRFNTLGYNVGRINNYVYHLEHARGHNSWLNNPHMQNNNNIWEEIQKMNQNQLKEYYSNQEYLKKYNG
jgi:predicted glycosyltransferase involved in capsule biosynthesis